VSAGNELPRPRLTLAGQLPYVEDLSDAQVKGIGALELLAAIGLLLPPLVHFATFLTPFAAVGQVLLMGGARGHAPAPTRATDGVGQVLGALSDSDHSRPMPAGTIIGHVNLQVDDTDSAVRFYRDGLGLLEHAFAGAGRSQLLRRRPVSPPYRRQLMGFLVSGGAARIGPRGRS
jgi:hypothetical protein